MKAVHHRNAEQFKGCERLEAIRAFDASHGTHKERVLPVTAIAVLSSDLIIPPRRYSASPFYSFVTKLNCLPRHQFARSRSTP